MKKVFSVVTAVVMTMVFATGALAAEWHPSRTQTGAALSGTEVTVTDAAGNATILDVANGGITVTNVADTLAGTSSLDATTNNNTNVVYQAALATDSVSTMLAKFANAEEANAAIAAQIAANKAATVERLNALRDELSSRIEQLKADGASEDEIAGAEQELAEVEVQIAATEESDYDSMDNYEPAALFDVSVYGDVAQALENGGSVEIPVKVDGITPESDVLALHFMGDLSDAEALLEELKTNADATIDEMSVEVIPCVAGDGMVTLTMSSFSPVMILTRAQTAVVENATPEQVPADTEEVTATPAPVAPEEEAQSTTGVAPWVYAVIVIVVVVVAGIVVVTRKKKTVTAGKK